MEVEYVEVHNIVPSEKPKEIQRKGVKSKVQTARVENGDKIEISTAAKKLQDSQAIFKSAVAALKNTPEVREDKVQEVRDKIEQGYFSSKEVKGDLAEKLLRNFGL